MNRNNRTFIEQCKKASLKKHLIVYNKDWAGETYRTSILFDDTPISEGGWFYGRKWMTGKSLVEAENRWVAQCYATGEHEPDYDTRNEWIPHQCGGCRWFAALDSDWGICCNKHSPNDGRATFEHGGCANHSDLTSQNGDYVGK